MRKAFAISCCLCLLAPAAGANPSTKVASGGGPDLSPELPSAVYKHRRDRLSRALGSCAAALRSFGRDGEPDPDFYYLTGIEESDAVLLLSPRSDIVKQALYLPPRNPEAEIWTGYREPMSPKLRHKYDVDEVRSSGRGLSRGLVSALRRNRCYAFLRSAMSKQSDVEAEVLGPMLQSLSARTVQRWEELEAMRTVKDAAEIARMRRAIAITIEGHRAAAVALRPGAVERQVAGAIEQAFYANGATGLAFPSIVGSGENGAVLHWGKSGKQLTDADVVVVDIGASFGHYAADVTRTYPVSGKFSDEQRRVYEIVLLAQQKVIDAVKPGISLDQLHRIGEQAILDAGYELPHYIGHYVGLDVHDVGDTGAPLKPGMVITVEPGVYLKGRFGVRIEDEVLVTTRGHELLTADLPRTVPDVEAWVAAARGE